MGFQTNQSKELPYQVKKSLRIRTSSLVGDRVLDPVITLEVFHARVHQGEQLVILDDLVLDVRDYMNTHPGGRFLIEQNLGRDISKFFYGGYSTENYDKLKPYNHSFDARQAVENLAVARLEGFAPKRLVKIERCEQVCNKTASTKCIKFKDLSQSSKVEDFSHQRNFVPLADLRSIGRHYVIKSTCHPHTADPSEIGSFESSKYGIRRHYTEAFAMRKGIYENLIRLCNRPTLEEGAQASYEVQQLIRRSNDDAVCLTLKDYKIQYGLSSYLFKDVDKR